MNPGEMVGDRPIFTHYHVCLDLGVIKQGESDSGYAIAWNQQIMHHKIHA